MEYYSYYTYSEPVADEIMATSVITGILVAMIMIIFAFGVLAFQYVCLWKIYKKMGEEGWKCLIPVYNLIVLYEKIGLSPYLLFIYLAGFLPFIGSLAIMTMGIIQSIYLGKAFKKEAGFLVGIALVPLVFEAILAFDKESVYGLNKEETQLNIENT